jgi:hypothetical protein
MCLVTRLIQNIFIKNIYFGIIFYYKINLKYNIFLV